MHFANFFSLKTALSVVLATVKLPAVEYMIETEANVSDEHVANQLKSLLDNNGSFPYVLNHTIEILDVNLTTGKHIWLWTLIAIQSYQVNVFSWSWNDKQSGVCFSSIVFKNLLLWLLPKNNQE